MFLIVGLGNPGDEYVRTRHNIGFLCVDRLAERAGLRFDSSRGKARIAEGLLGNQRVVLAKPQTFMNLSGQAVVTLANWYKIDAAEELVVVYDDLDIAFGTLRIRRQGSPGTHNGMRSIVQLLGSQQFARLRLGINRVPPGWDAARYVLSRWAKDEEQALPTLLDVACDALELLVREGIGVAMNRYNGGAHGQ